ncbi:MAG TPA: glycosyltransferase family 2 protein [Stellaceae bacterium]|nr:glycosyltransferase family 2 protein [Stellaceae bacterium]
MTAVSSTDNVKSGSPTLRGADVSVVMITMNEEKAVAKVIGDIQAVLPDAEIVIVDSSRDSTPDIAAALGATVIRQYPPRGYGRAMDLALRSFTRRVAVTMDCDDTYPVDFIAPMARMVLDEGYDLVDGSRLERKPSAMPWINYLANRGFALVASAMFGRSLTDLHSGMRAYRQGLVADLDCDPSGPALPVDLILRTVRKGYKVRSIFIPYRERIGQSTMQPLQSAYWTAKRILGARFS